MRNLPRPQLQNSRFIKRTFIAAVAAALINSCYTLPASAANFTEEDTSTNPNTDLTLLNVSSDTEYDSISIVHHPQITRDQYTVQVNNSSLTVKGPTSIKLHATDYATGSDQGNYALYVNAGTVELNGDVDISVFQKSDKTEVTDIGANGIWATDGAAKVTLGSQGTTTKIWTIATKPDSLSAKNGASITINSTNNQIIGSIDTATYIPANHPANQSPTGEIIIGETGASVTGTFSGPDSYWYGDDQSWGQASFLIQGLPFYDGPIKATYKDLATSEDYPLLSIFPEFQQIQENYSKDKLNLTFENGAQWTYFGLDQIINKSIDVSLFGKNFTIDVNLTFNSKRISAITLKKDGIINLYDEDIKKRWEEIGLLDAWPELKEQLDEIKHDYVQIGDLKGDQGIFRLDLSAEDRSQSDMIFVEGSSNESMGTFYIEPYNMDQLESVSPDNTLAFALVDHDAKVQFADKINLEGETLFDYELEIDHRNLTNADLEKDQPTTKSSESSEFHGQIEASGLTQTGESDADTVWFIKRINMKESSAALAMTGIGYAAYDAAVEMDRLDLRAALSQHSDGNTGLWVRLLGGSTGIEGQYDWDRTGVVVGADHQVGSHTLGAWFSYEKGNADLLDVTGQGDLSRYEFALYDTIHFGSQYLDLVGRIGRVSAEFDASNPAYRTTGSFDQDYGALSAEYGWTLLHQPSGFFVEPQAQIQAAYLRNASYDASRGMHVEAESETSVLGRFGFRFGKALAGDRAQGQIYARADVLHQFTDGQDAVLSDAEGHRLGVNWGDRGTWAQAGIGAAVNWDGRYSLQFGIDRAFGGDIENAWQATGRFSVLF